MSGPPPFVNANNRVSPSGPSLPGGSGGGDIDGTVGTVDNAVPRADGTGGTTLQGSLLVVNDAGQASGITFANPSAAQQPATKAYSDAGDAATLVAAEAYADGKIGGTTGGADNHVLRSDGTGGKTAQASLMIVDDAGLASGITFSDPSAAQQPATKAYVDAHTGIGGTVGTVDNAVPRANGTGGTTLQGSLLVVDDAGLASGITFSDPTTALQPANKEYVDAAAAGALKVLRIATALATVSSVVLLPANAVVYETGVKVTTPYSPGTTIQVGRASSVALLQATTDNAPASPAAIYVNATDTFWGGTAAALLVTIAGAPSVGAGFVYVHYAIPLA